MPNILLFLMTGLRWTLVGVLILDLHILINNKIYIA